MSDDKGTNATIGLAVLMIGLVSLPIKGWVLAKLWLWFFVPHDLPAFTWVEGSALSLIVSLLIWNYAPDREKKDWPTQLGRALAGPVVSLMALLVGALLKAVAL